MDEINISMQGYISIPMARKKQMQKAFVEDRHM